MSLWSHSSCLPAPAQDHYMWQFAIYIIYYIYIILQGHFSDANPKWKIRNYMQTMCKRSMSHTYTHLLYGPNLHPTKFCCLCRHKGHVETSHKPSKHKSLTMHTLHFMMCSMLMISNNDDVEKRILRKPQHLERRWAAQNMCRWSDSPWPHKRHLKSSVQLAVSRLTTIHMLIYSWVPPCH